VPTRIYYNGRTAHNVFIYIYYTNNIVVTFHTANTPESRCTNLLRVFFFEMFKLWIHLKLGKIIRFVMVHLFGYNILCIYGETTTTSLVIFFCACEMNSKFKYLNVRTFYRVHIIIPTCIERPRAGNCQPFKGGELTNSEFLNRRCNFPRPFVRVLP